MSARRVALVTGSRKGIGRGLAEHFVGAGYEVIGCSRRPAEWELPGYEHFLADVAEETQVNALLEHVRRRYGELGVLLNNAGIAAMNHVLLTPGATIDRIVRTNLVGTALVSRESAKLMMQKKWGRIVNFSTVAVPLRLEGEAVYAASKEGVEGFTRVFAREVARWGITVNAIGLPPVETDLTQSVPRETLDAVLQRLTLKRFGTVPDVLNLVDFLIRPESDAVTGQVIYLGGP